MNVSNKINELYKVNITTVEIKVVLSNIKLTILINWGNK
jgi:hypothetical protein